MARPGLMKHRKFRRLVAMLPIPIPQARGILEMIWEVAYECGDPYLGDATDVEAAAMWEGTPGELCQALLTCGGDGPGFIEPVSQGSDRYQVHDLWDHAPDYVRRRRERELLRKEKGAVLSSQSPASDRSVSGQRPVSDQSLTGQRPGSDQSVTGQSPVNGEETSASDQPVTGQCPVSVRSMVHTRAPAPAPAPAPAAATAASPLPRGGQPNATPAAAAAAATTALQVLEAWNEACLPPIKPVQRLSRALAARIERLLDDPAFLSEWPEICRRINASQFCRGHGKQGFVATLGWAIKPETWEKVLAGEYDDANLPAPDPHRRPSSAEKAADLRDRISRFEQAGRKDIADQLRRELSELEGAHV